MLAVPMLRDGDPIGAIVVGWADAGPIHRPAGSRCCKTFADQAVIAIENVRLFKELEARTARLTQSVGELKALGEVGQAVSSTLDLATVLSTIVSRATQLAGMDGGAIYEYDEAREEFHLHTADRLPDELVDALRATPIRKGEGAIGQLAVTGEPVEIRDIMRRRRLPEPRPRRSSSDWAIDRCWPCRSCARTTCSADWSSTGRAPANSHRR